MGASTKTRLKELKRINSQRPSTTKGNSNLCPVSSIFLGGSSFRIRSQSEQESGIYIGLLDKQSSCGLKKLLSNYKVRLQFYIPLQGASDPARGGVPVYINVYGPASLFDCVGKLLTDCELFLQRPIQIDTDVSYENPQCLRLGHSRSGHGATNTRAFVDFENEVSALFESITPSLLAQNRFAQTGYGIRTKLKK